MQAQFKIYEIKSWGQDSSPSYISMELLQLTRELGWGTLTQKQDMGALQNRPQEGSSVFLHSLKYLKISFSSSQEVRIQFKKWNQKYTLLSNPLYKSKSPCKFL